jgi:hypothetical protein
MTIGLFQSFGAAIRRLIVLLSFIHYFSASNCLVAIIFYIRFPERKRKFQEI